MGILDFFKFNRKVDKKNQIKQPGSEDELLSLLANMMLEASTDGISSDQFPNGIGVFGFSVDNPVPCFTIPGSYTYLSQLRFNGQPVKYDRIGSFGSSIIPNSIDGYIITSSTDEKLGTIYLSPYQKKNSLLAPNGFTLSE